MKVTTGEKGQKEDKTQDFFYIFFFVAVVFLNAVMAEDE